jgi:hypothetical protein
MKHWGHLLIAAGMAAAAIGAEADGTRVSTASAAQRAAAGRPPTGGRAVLPDPVLLDGSTHAAEKKSEYGMIGDFELPGDENNRNGKVGGSQGGGQEEANDSAKNQAGGGGGAQKEGAEKPGGGKAGSQTAQAGGAGDDPKAANKQGGGAGEPNAQPQGMKVAELGGDPSGAMPDQPDSKKPTPVAIGDKAMRIPQQTQSTAGVVGAQQPAGPNTQVYEKATGTGGKAPTGQQGPNRVEKGRTIPSGL